MDGRTYWIELFTVYTWREFNNAGGNISGFRMRKWKSVSQIKPGDYLLCYLSGVSRFIAVLEVTSEPYQDDKKIWEDDIFPCRIDVRKIIELTPETAVPVQTLRNQLTVFKNLKNPNVWSIVFRHSPARINSLDAEKIIEALSKAKEKPVTRPMTTSQLAYLPRVLK